MYLPNLDALMFNIYIVLGATATAVVLYVIIQLSLIGSSIKKDTRRSAQYTLPKQGLLMLAEPDSDKSMIERYRELVDEKYLRGLTEQETQELEFLKVRVDLILDRV